MAVQYETKATNVGGRKGHVHDDNAINVDVLPPQQAMETQLTLNNYSQLAMLHASMVHMTLF